MAKTRAQRKAERRAREEQERKRIGGERTAESRAQHDTQVPVSGEIAEIEAVERGKTSRATDTALDTPDPPKPTPAHGNSGFVLAGARPPPRRVPAAQREA